MKAERIDGILFENMLRQGAVNLERHRLAEKDVLRIDAEPHRLLPLRHAATELKMELRYTGKTQTNIN